MKAVDQTRFGPQEGNCLTACIASIVECSIDDLPDLWEAEKAGKNWLAVLNKTLSEKFGLWYFSADPRRNESGFTAWWSPPGYYVMGGKSPRPECVSGHAVVALNGEIVHDPHPSRAGLVDVEDYGFLIKLFS